MTTPNFVLPISTLNADCDEVDAAQLPPTGHEGRILVEFDDYSGSSAVDHDFQPCTSTYSPAPEGGGRHSGCWVTPCCDVLQSNPFKT